jgi:type II secretory pathway pseudopilin PulG
MPIFRRERNLAAAARGWVSLPAGFNPEGNGFNPEGNGFNPEGNGFNPEGNGFNPEGNGFNPEGNGFNPEGNGFNPEGNGFNPEGNGFNPEGNGFNPEGKKSRFLRKFAKSSRICQKTGFSRLARSSRVPKIGNWQSAIENGFSLVEIMVVVVLLSLVVLALMAVFSSTQRAFRASVTQTDVLEGGRATMEIMASDLRGLAPSGGSSNYVTYGAVNFFSLANYTYYTPLVQSLPGSSLLRTNLLNYFFVLGRENTKWTCTAYIVDSGSANPLYPLYRFYAETNTANSPWTLYSLFTSKIQTAQWHTNLSHMMDGVVHLTVRAYDTNGVWINNNNVLFPYTKAANTQFVYPANGFGNAYGEVQLFMYSNTVPAAVELELGVLEDHVLARADSLSQNALRQSNYLSGQAGAVHLFRQRVSIPNVDPSAYP